MEIEKSRIISAPIERVWAMMFDTKLVAACVPGMESIEMVSDTEYTVQIRVKISFISARFKVRTKIVEMRAPSYVRSDGIGEDSTLTSSLKLSSEAFLAARDDKNTELRLKVKVEVFGRLGTFGLNVIKTKADRMWEEFGQNLAARIQPSALESSISPLGA